MSTALQLVNRVRRRFREEDTSVLTDDLSVFILDLLNEAKRDLLEAFTWDFDLRSDGELTTAPALVGKTVNLGSFLNQVTTLQVTSDDLDYSAVCRMVVTSDPDYGDTALRIATITNAGGALYVLTLANPWPGPTTSGATASFYFDEYVLPATVRAVTSMRHQERDVRLVEVDRDTEIDVYAPRPHADTGDSPITVFIGKTAQVTYDPASSPSGGARGVSVKFDQTPDESLIFSYSYVYRHPDLSSSQALVGVDPAVEDLIVRLAEARGTMSSLGADIETGAVMEQEVLNRASALRGNQRRDPLRRIVLGPTNPSVRSRYGFGRVPRNFGSL